MGDESTPENQTPAPRRRRFSRETLEIAALSAEIVGAVAVVLTIAFLALQISENNKLLVSQTYFNFLEVAHKPIAMHVQDAEFSVLLQKCSDTPDETTPAEWERCSSFFFIMYNGWEYTYYQSEDDALPKGLHEGADAYYRSLLSKPGYRKWWPEYRFGYGEPFKSYVEEAFDAATPDAAMEAEQ